jgi:hypothetical protein
MDEISCGNEPVTLSIPFSQLAIFLGKAEEIQDARESRAGGQSIKSKRQTRKRKLSSSSAEELRPDNDHPSCMYLVNYAGRLHLAAVPGRSNVPVRLGIVNRS